MARGIPPFLVGWIVYRFEVPSPWRLLQFLLTVVGAVLVASRLWTAVATLSFWMTDGSGAMQLGVTINVLACGGNVPLQFFPDSMLQVLRVMPWAATIQRPVEVYLGLSGPVSVLALQLFWFTVLHVLVRFELNAARHRLVINGG